jgi:hypothetical protein
MIFGLILDGVKIPVFARLGISGPNNQRWIVVKHFLISAASIWNSQIQSHHTFASGESATPSGGKTSGMSRRATPIRLSAIP